ncbi:MAG: class IV adenylate cyclase [Spirochaetaceae bacterium]
MAYEIEVKAWITDPVAMRAELTARAVSIKDYVKEDVYFRAPVVPAPGASSHPAGGFPPTAAAPQEFRLRREGGSNVCTFKDKTIRRGVEVNREYEFTVSDGDAFEALVVRSGCTVFARKRKVGSVFALPEANVELSHVDGLGDFVEVEKLVVEDHAATHDAAEQTVRRILESLGVEESAIEGRPYTTLIAEKEQGAL